MKILKPKIHKAVCITDNIRIAAEISSLFRKRGYYFTVLDSPRMERADASNEIIRRNNVCARIRPDHIYLVDLQESAIIGFSKLIRKPPLEIINNIDEIKTKIVNSKTKKRKILEWGSQNISVGLVKAKMLGMQLKINLENSPSEYYIKGENNKLVVYEDRMDITAIIAANYAFSIGSSFLQIPSIDEKIIKDIQETFYTIYDNNEIESVSVRLGKLRLSIRTLLPNYHYQTYSSITFITDGMPWGFSFPEIPTTHIISYPDMGNTIANAITSSQKWSEGIRVALLVDPGDAKISELSEVSEILTNQGTIVKKLFGKNATVYEVANSIKLIPFDILFISTHAGEIPGRRLTYKYTDSEHHERVLVVDNAVSFGFQPGSNMVNVLEYERFVSLDGISWDDKEKKKNLYIGRAIIDYSALKQKNAKQLILVNSEDINRVYGAMALRMYDGDLITGILHSIAEASTPIIINNSCSSWKEMARSFTFGGAISYIGTLFPITDIEAKQFISSLFSKKNSGKQLAFSIWQAQKLTYETGRNPYIMFGPDFLSISPPKVKTDDYLLEQLIDGKKRWQQKLREHDDEGVKKNSAGHVEFIEKELNGFIKFYHANN